jgi:hypothetical protein
MLLAAARSGLFQPAFLGWPIDPATAPKITDTDNNTSTRWKSK